MGAHAELPSRARRPGGHLPRVFRPDRPPSSRATTRAARCSRRWASTRHRRRRARLWRFRTRSRDEVLRRCASSSRRSGTWRASRHARRVATSTADPGASRSRPEEGDRYVTEGPGAARTHGPRAAPDLPARLPSRAPLARRGRRDWSNEQTLIVVPPRCVPPEQFVGTRRVRVHRQSVHPAQRNWGVGDFSDLAALAVWAARSARTSSE